MDLAVAVIYIKGITAAVAAVFLVLTSRLFVHMLQQEGYKVKGLFLWLARNMKKAYGFTGLSAAVLVALQAAVNIFLVHTGIVYLVSQGILLLLFAAAFAVSFKKLKVRNAKKPLVYTARVKRLYFAISFVSLVFSGALYLPDIFALHGTWAFGLLLFLALVIQPDAVILANVVMMPVESGVKRWYFNDAKKILKNRTDLIRVGITGSYGKTSTKFILGTILSEKYSTLVTPSSFNTPMGLTRVIREQLKEGHEVFIAEMGARHVGDISELTGLVHPKYGIVTSVGPQHLETFKTIENVKDTKFELIRALPGDGTAFFNADNEYCREMFEMTNIDKKLYGMEYEGSLYVRASDYATGVFGSRFTLAFEGGKSVEAKTRLLGRHNILNIAGCAAIAYALGLTPEEIASGISKLEPVEHRLNILPTDNGVTVIDDAFNSNPQGVKMAMEVLSGFTGRKIVITPGMVELGERESEENYNFGRIMSEVADIVFLIGEKHTKPIYGGLSDGGFDMRSVYVYNTLEEATARLGEVLMKGDVVIFENDLPDNYNE
jgi:UDP-N-acetylmuramoyl-tripeptide--D-alanyl-D-alanine ligase